MSQLTIKGELKQLGFNYKSFLSKKKGTQYTKDFVIEIKDGEYVNHLLITAWNKTIEEVEDSMNTGERTFHIEPSSRFYNEKWYTSVKVWRVS